MATKQRKQRKPSQRRTKSKQSRTKEATRHKTPRRRQTRAQKAAAYNRKQFWAFVHNAGQTGFIIAGAIFLYLVYSAKDTLLYIMRYTAIVITNTMSTVSPVLPLLIIVGAAGCLFVILSRFGLIQELREWYSLTLDYRERTGQSTRHYSKPWIARVIDSLLGKHTAYTLEEPDIPGLFVTFTDTGPVTTLALPTEDTFALAQAVQVRKATRERDIKYAAHAKAISGGYAKPLQRPQRRLDVVDLSDDKTPHSDPTALTEALQQTGRHSILLGQTVEGEPVTFDLANESGLGIFGKSGTGKSARAGVTFALSAIHNGAHVYVLDKDSNRVWGQLSTHIEHVTDFYGNGDIWGQLQAEFSRRQKLLQGETSNYQRRNKRSRSDTAMRPLQPIIIIFEEYKHFCQSPENKDILAEANALLSTIASQGRKFGMHVVIIAQAPDNKAMPQSVVENLSPLSFYQPSNSGAKRVNLSGLSQLDKDNGEFMYEGEICQAWDTWESDIASILARIPRKTLKAPITMGIFSPRIDDNTDEAVDALEGIYRAIETSKTPKKVEVDYMAISSKSERIAAYLEAEGYNGKRKEVAAKLDVDPSYVSRAVKELGL